VARIAGGSRETRIGSSLELAADNWNYWNCWTLGYTRITQGKEQKQKHQTQTQPPKTTGFLGYLLSAMEFDYSFFRK
jgi:hypothetical protein